MKKPKREVIDETTITIDGQKRSLREHLVATEGRADSAEFSKESARFLSALPRTTPRGKAPPTKPKAIYSRKLSPAEVAQEEEKRMAAQAEKTLKFLLNHPNEWHTARTICEGIDEPVQSASPTVSRVAVFLNTTEPDMMLIRKVGRAREMFFKGVADDVDEWSRRYHEAYKKWFADHITQQKADRIAGKGKRKPAEQMRKLREQRDDREVKGKTAEELEAGLRSFLPGEKLTIEVKGSISILFGFVKGGD
jgi:hypothetical protein